MKGKHQSANLTEPTEALKCDDLGIQQAQTTLLPESYLI